MQVVTAYIDAGMDLRDEAVAAECAEVAQGELHAYYSRETARKAGVGSGSPPPGFRPQSELTLEERRKTVSLAKQKPRCRACGKFGHWAGDKGTAKKGDVKGKPRQGPPEQFVPRPGKRGHAMLCCAYSSAHKCPDKPEEPEVQLDSKQIGTSPDIDHLPVPRCFRPCCVGAWSDNGPCGRLCRRAKNHGYNHDCLSHAFPGDRQAQESGPASSLKRFGLDKDDPCKLETRFEASAYVASRLPDRRCVLHSSSTKPSSFSGRGIWDYGTIDDSSSDDEVFVHVPPVCYMAMRACAPAEPSPDQVSLVDSNSELAEERDDDYDPCDEGEESESEDSDDASNDWPTPSAPASEPEVYAQVRKPAPSEASEATAQGHGRGCSKTKEHDISTPRRDRYEDPERARSSRGAEGSRPRPRNAPRRSASEAGSVPPFPSAAGPAVIHADGLPGPGTVFAFGQCQGRTFLDITYNEP